MNSKLALPEEVLLSIEKPARYIGNEVNAVIKDKDSVAIRVAMCFPDVYEIGMSHLGLQILYDLFNSREDTWCERVFSPWLDLDARMRKDDISLFALESQDPILDFDFLGITIQYEMCYTNILQVLDLSKIPLLATERDENHPFVMGGGPCTYNPEPIADFFDFFYIGEGEVVYDQLLDMYNEHKEKGGSRNEFLKKAACIEGIYVPSFYDITYLEDGTIEAFTPKQENAKEKIKRQVVTDLNETMYLKKPIVPYIKVTQDRVVLEIQRGCIRGCRFCQAGTVYRPNRERNLETLKEQARELLQNTGHEEISLSSLSSSDYSHLEELISFLMEEKGRERLNISLPSLRIDAFSLDVMQKVQDVKKSSLTFAPEAGSQRLRNVINKGLSEENIIDGSKEAFKGGWTKVKLYFMLGLPTETLEDRKDIARLSNMIAKTYFEIPKEDRFGKCQITTSTSFFIPKPFTPFQWEAMYSRDDYISKAADVQHEMREQVHKKCLRYNWHEADVTVIEGFLARGDRRASKVLMEAYSLGCLYDAWSETFHYDVWMQAFANAGIDMDFYNRRIRSYDEVLPWDFIDVGVTKNFLVTENERAKEELITPNCREGCSACGALVFGGGVCYEG